jgi:phenylacetate-CoA ligase
VITFRHDTGCACGRTLPVLDPVVTKAEDSIVTGSGRVISPSLLTWAFKDLSGVRSSQIVQRDDLSVEVRVVADSSQGHATKQALASRLSEMLFGEVPVTVVLVDKLDVTTAGKSRFVVNERDPTGPTPERDGTLFRG